MERDDLPTILIPMRALTARVPRTPS